MLYATVRQRKIHVKNPVTVIQNGVGVDHLQLSMDDEWMDMDSIVCVFTTKYTVEEEKTEEVEKEDGTKEEVTTTVIVEKEIVKEMLHTFGEPILVPWENLEKTGVLSVSCTGYVSDQKVMTTMMPDSFWNVVQNGPITGEKPMDATPSLYDQVIAAAGSAETAAKLANDVAVEIRTAKENGDFNGKDGLTPAIEIGSVLTGVPGGDAQVTNSGTPSNVVLNFVIPRGAQGIQGIPGTPGAPGRNGRDGKDGTPGRDGVDGRDGTNGAPGKDGIDGIDGVDGYTPVRDVDYWTESDREKIVNDVLVSLMSMSYAKYNTIEDALAETNATANGKVATYTDRHGVYQVILLGDISSNVTISVTRDCNLQLNGHKISFTASGAYLDVNTASAVSIDGTKTGSRVELANTTSTKEELVVKSTNTHLTIIGGTYAMKNVTCKGGRVFRGGNLETRIDMTDCTASITGTRSTGKIYGGTLPLSKLDNCTFDIDVDGASGIDVVGVAAFVNDEMNNCTMNVKATGQNVLVFGTRTNSSATLTLTDCDITVDGMGDYTVNGETVSVNLHAVYGNANGTVNINGGRYVAPRDGILIEGKARIDGGVFEGCQHGGAYLSGGDILVKNATFRNIPYYGDHEWSHTRGGACYVGGEPDSVANANVKFYKCKFESDDTGSTNGLRCKGTNCTAYISDSVIEPMFAHDLSVAGGCNIYVGANVSYRRDKVEGSVDTTTYAGQSFAW